MLTDEEALRKAESEYMMNGSPEFRAGFKSALKWLRSQGEPVVAFTDEHISYINRFGGNCRDCADENGICPSRGLPCADSKKAIRFVLEALAYGINHKHVGRLFAPQPAIPDGWQLVPKEPTQWMRTVGENGLEDNSVVKVWESMLAAAPEPKSC